VAAVGVGTAAVAAGWAWGALLLVFFVSSSALSRAGRARKTRRTGAVVAKGGTRDAAQVLANGGVFAVACAALAGLAVAGASGSTLAVLAVAGASGSTLAVLAGGAAGAIAAAAADTWATEVGTLVGGTPRTVAGWRPVAPGTSGAVTLAGTAAMLAGAAAMAGAARLLALGAAAGWGALAGGVAGATLDTLLGAAVQERRRCPRCGTATEQPVHAPCGTATVVAGGWPGIGNDAVNVSCTVAGALVGGAAARAVAGGG
jgi:uncharacterized membrane protein